MNVAPQILEVHVLTVSADASDSFVRSFLRASEILASMPNHASHELHRSADVSGSYILLINWRSIGNHIVDFRQSLDYRNLMSLLGEFCEQISSMKSFYGPPLTCTVANTIPRLPADIDINDFDDLVRASGAQMLPVNG